MAKYDLCEKQVRVPLAAAAVARQLAEIYLGRAWEDLRETRWYKSAPPTADISLTLTGIETRHARELDRPQGYAEMRTVLVCVARDNAIGEATEILIEI